MKICFVAPANNYHTKKWANWFLGRGNEIHVVSFINDEIPGVTVHYIDTGAGPEGGDASKLKYLLHAIELKKIVETIKPDIINVHYATSYGTVAALSGIKPYVLSVWGSDIYDFPQKGPLHKAMLKYSLKKATWLFSTSKAMAEEGNKYTKKQFEITPFGVDMNLFNPTLRTNNREKFVIGTAKKLEEVYGIEYLLKAISILKKKYPEMNIELRIAGDGPLANKYRNLATNLDIENITTWLGFISQAEVAYEWANMDVAVIYSNQESFGVSAVEAQACGTVVIISDIPGLRETTVPGETSIAVKPKNENELAQSIKFLYDNPEIRKKMGDAGRKYVIDRFELDLCFEDIDRKFKNHVGEL